MQLTKRDAAGRVPTSMPRQRCAYVHELDMPSEFPKLDCLRFAVAVDHLL